MRIYKVGGAVRDELLGLEPTDNDWVVVGSTPKEMLSMGYKQVGKDFPVFIHPETKEEYALARKERSIGPGHTAFNFSYSPNVTLEEDLSRRDITINAIAMDDSGNLIDPFNGKDDLDNKVIRHVTDAFIEDPLRVLRVARFYAKLKEFKFNVDGHTRTLCGKLINSIKHLPGERIWQETEKALKLKNGFDYFDMLNNFWRGGDRLSWNNFVLNKQQSGVTSIWDFHPPTYYKDFLERLNEKDFLERLNIRWTYKRNVTYEWGDPIEITPEILWFIVCDILKYDSDIKYINERLKIPKKFKKTHSDIRKFCMLMKRGQDSSLLIKPEELYDALEKIGDKNNYIDTYNKFKIALRVYAEYPTLYDIYDDKKYTENEPSELENFFINYYKITIGKDDSSLKGEEIKEKIKMKKIELIEQYYKKILQKS